MSVYPKPGERGTTYYYEFMWQRQRYRKEGFPTKRLAEHAEGVRKTEVQTQGHEALYGSLGPKLLTWAEALALYREAKAGVDTQAMIMARLTWWATWAEAHGAPYIQAMSLEIIKSGLKHLQTTPGEGKGRRYKKGRSPQTQKHYVRQLHAFYETAVHVWGCMTRNPVKQLGKAFIHVPKFKARILEVEERRRLTLAAELHMRRFIIVGLCTGIRETAILEITAEDFQVRPGELRAWDRKPGQEPEEYFIPVIPALKKVVQELGVLKGRLWRFEDGTVMHRFQRKMWLRALEQAGFMAKIPIERAPRPVGTPGPAPRTYRLTPTLRFHDLRHMVGVALAEAGVPEAVIQEFMHHASREASRIYTKWVSRKALAAAGEKLAAAHNFDD